MTRRLKIWTIFVSLCAQLAAPIPVSAGTEVSDLPDLPPAFAVRDHRLAETFGPYLSTAVARHSLKIDEVLPKLREAVLDPHPYLRGVPYFVGYFDEFSARLMLTFWLAKKGYWSGVESGMANLAKPLMFLVSHLERENMPPDKRAEFIAKMVTQIVSTSIDHFGFSRAGELERLNNLLPMLTIFLNDTSSFKRAAFWEHWERNWGRFGRVLGAITLWTLSGGAGYLAHQVFNMSYRGPGIPEYLMSGFIGCVGLGVAGAGIGLLFFRYGDWVRLCRRFEVFPQSSSKCDDMLKSVR